MASGWISIAMITSYPQFAWRGCVSAQTNRWLRAQCTGRFFPSLERLRDKCFEDCTKRVKCKQFTLSVESLKHLSHNLSNDGKTARYRTQSCQWNPKFVSKQIIKWVLIGVQKSFKIRYYTHFTRRGPRFDFSFQQKFRQISKIICSCFHKINKRKKSVEGTSL